ncbi:MAG: 2-oxoglutarate dehydrogenase E1 component [Verrucomicrobiales bacterium]|nr:2-oxoglutarate dehydrogenase E1 component [Verrucomicrobiales bacterium]MCP5527793.1 2-oxoglutarate dehydrogenase E1 component [Verrucomicrobiales bacterium]
MQAHSEWPEPANLEFVEQLYADYLRAPAGVAPEWQRYFAALGDGDGSRGTGFRPSFRRRSLFAAGPSAPASAGPLSPVNGESMDAMLRLQHRVDRLIRAFRVRGHMQARIDPLSDFVPYVPQLDPEYYDFTLDDLNRRFVCETMCGDGRLTLQDILQRLRATYCGAVGVQYMHIDDLKVRHWLQDRIEGGSFKAELSRAQQLRILRMLTDAIVFEQFIRRKFVGAKSFSLEGAESLVPLLDLAIEQAAEHGVREIVLGMAHRGRLNVLANIIGKSPREIFREFEDKDPELYMGGGDVKYHMGYSSDHVTATGRPVHLSLCFNPSHLGFVSPVVLGRVRAKQDRAGDADRQEVMGLVIHGDAAFAGEGITQETLNLSLLESYRTGGTVHVIVNNQIGFTTPPAQGRSGNYATSVARMLRVPIFHVNGEDPEAVARCIQLALDFRREFQHDVVIDMYCYRRLGHNEGDEPSFTQPLLYRLIEQRPSVRDAYLQRLLELGGVTREEADRIAEKRQTHLEEQLSLARTDHCGMPPSSLSGIWKGYHGEAESTADDPETGLPREELADLLTRLSVVPADFTVHPKLKRVLDQRREMAVDRRPLDWAAGEALALGSLAIEGCRIRLSGQDCERGTFSHRHAVLHDYQKGGVHRPFQKLSPAQGPVEIVNSPLSEAGVMGFEYGYSLDCPDGLVLWEAQFGDFVNVAQVIIDQFISSGEDKWRRLSGLVLLLPHGFEGMGPEHSSARLERFLMLAAEDNLQVAQPTTPAQFFHLLRRQVRRRWRKPLVVMTPKSMLRHPQAVSPLEDCTHGRFQRVIPDPRGVDMRNVSRVLLCSGKLYYDLEARRQKLGRDDVAIVRLEQLYPYPRAEIEQLLSPCPAGTNVIWVQDEPENMGAWRFLRVTVSMQFLDRLPFSGVCRPASASPATGSAAAHQAEQEQLLASAFGGEDDAERPRTETIISAKQLVATEA